MLLANQGRWLTIKKRELKLEKLNSQRLKGYFKENPKDEHLLSQGKTMENMEQEEHQKNVPEEPCHEATSLDSYYKIPWEALYHEAPGLALYHNVPRLPCSYKFPEPPVLSRLRGYPDLLMFLGCPVLLRFLGCLVLTRLLGWLYITRFLS